MTKPAEATLGDISLNRLAVCECSASMFVLYSNYLVLTRFNKI